MTIFKAYDVRGVYPSEINEKVAFNVGAAFGTFLAGQMKRAPEVLVGRDVRLSSPSLKKEFVDGLLSTGANVVDIGIATTPVVKFSTTFYKFDAGASITASHNPKEYNGLKFIDSKGIPISYGFGISNIEELSLNKKFLSGSGRLTEKNVYDDYASFILGKVNLKNQGLKVVIDAGNGAGGLIFPYVLKKTGVEVVELYCSPDGSFPNHHPDPSIKKNLIDLQKKVLEVNADLGLACDGDGDRFAVVEGSGKILAPKLVFAILISNLLRKKQNDKVIYDVLASKSIEEYIKRSGGIPLVSRVGHAYMQRKLVDENASLAGEVSGHYFFSEIFGIDDAIFAGLKVLEFFSASSDGFRNVERDLTNYNFDEMRIEVKDSEKFKFVDKLREEFLDNKMEIDCLDGVKVSFPYGWALFRPSNTEPKISIAYEAYSEDRFEDVKNFVNGIVSRIPK